MLIGIQKNCGTMDTRRPILLPLLKKLVLSLKSIVRHSYDQKLFQAMFLLAFCAFLRIGEMTFSRSSPDNILKTNDVKIRCQTVEMSLRNYKHSHGQGPKRLILKKRSDKSLCPVTSFKSYLSYRGHLAGHLFITQLGKPLTRDYFSVIFKSCLCQS